MACDSARPDKYFRLILQIVFGGSALDHTLEHCSPEVTVTHPSHVPGLAQYAAASVPSEPIEMELLLSLQSNREGAFEGTSAFELEPRAGI